MQNCLEGWCTSCILDGIAFGCRLKFTIIYLLYLSRRFWTGYEARKI